MKRRLRRAWKRRSVDRNFHGRVYDSLPSILRNVPLQSRTLGLSLVMNDAFNDNKETFNRFCDGLSIEEEGVLNGDCTTRNYFLTSLNGGLISLSRQDCVPPTV